MTSEVVENTIIIVMERFRFYKFLFLLVPAVLFLVFVNPLKILAASTFSITVNTYYDTNGNGVKDTTEQAFPNANITLSSGQTAVTNSTGLATFSNLPACPTSSPTSTGCYAVSFTNVPSGYNNTTSNPVIVAILTSNATANFGIAIPVTPTNPPLPTPTVKPTATPVPPPPSGNYGVTAKYCPQGVTTPPANHCGTTYCDNNGVNYPSYIGSSDCTYHSWNCSGNSCGTEYNTDFWSTSCDKTNTDRNATGAGPSVPPRCVPPAPSGAKCVINSTNNGYNITWTAITYTTYNVYSGGGTLLTTVSTNSYLRNATNMITFIIKSLGGGRESAKGTTVTCPAVPTPTNTPVPPTATPTLKPTATPTPTNIPTPTATPTPLPNSTILSLVVGIDGVGSTGDNASPNNSSGSNKNPLHPTRNVTVGIYNSSNQLITSANGNIVYNTTTGKFAGTVNLGTNFTTGNYLVSILTDAHLQRVLPGIQTITSGITNTLPSTNVVAGDLNKDNALTILDYNILLSCSIYSQDNNALCKSNPNFSTFSDLDDNGTVDQFDYNLFVREYSVQNGDQNP